MPVPHAKIDSLDGLRGLAALYVMIYHYQMNEHLGFHPLMTFLNHGYLAVDLFFVLSGYVISLADKPLMEGGDRGAAIRWFMIKRLARIYPLYLVSTAIALVVLWLLGDPAHGGLANIAANLLMIQAWGLGESINGATWSLSAEWAAYLLFPIFCLVGGGRRGAAVQIILGSAALLVAASPLARNTGLLSNGPLDVNEPFTLWPVVRCLGGFLIGCGLRSIPLRPGALLNTTCDLAAVLAAAVLFVSGSDLVFVALMAIVIACLPTQTGWASRVMAARGVVWLGRISFSIYLLHTAVFPLEQRFADYLPLPHGPARAVTLLLFYTGVIACAQVSYRYIERPGQNVLRRLLGAKRQARLVQSPA